ncbi:MAG: hypothetical protein ACREAA_10320 [Candidatus Polarisedimenticolia bacterium]
MNAVVRVGLVLAAVSSLWTVASAELRDDPQALLTRIQGALVTGDVASAASAASRLRALLKSDARWDPDGRIASSQLPALEKRIATLRSASSATNLLLQRSSRRLEGARPVDDDTELAHFLEAENEAATQVIAELDRITGTVPPGTDRGGLMQADLYQGALRTMMARSLPELSEDFPLGSCAEGEQATLLTARMETLKREIMSLSAELAAARSSRQREQKLLMEFIGQAPSGLAAADAAGLSKLGTALAHRIRKRLDAVRSLKGQTPLQKMLSLEELERLRLVNAISVAGGSRDLGARLDVLAASIEAVPSRPDGCRR